MTKKEKKVNLESQRSRAHHKLAGCYVACNRARYIHTEFKAQLRFDLMPSSLLEDIRMAVRNNYLSSQTQEEAIILYSMCTDLGMLPLSYVGKMQAYIWLTQERLYDPLSKEIKVLRDMVSMDYDIAIRSGNNGHKYLRLFKAAGKSEGNPFTDKKTPIVKPQFTGVLPLLAKYLLDPKEQAYRDPLSRIVKLGQPYPLKMQEYR